MENYEVLKPIGKGKFAIVYRAQRKGDDELGKTATLLVVFLSFEMSW